jgi:hypothetical protein
VRVGRHGFGWAGTDEGPSGDAPITKFIEAFKKGDMAWAAATHAAEADLVIDEVPPFLWRGAPALKAWAADLERDAKAQGITDGWLIHGWTWTGPKPQQAPGSTK